VRDVIKKIEKAKPTVAFVGVASLKDNRLIYAVISAFIKAGCNCHMMRAVIAPFNADLNKAREVLQNADGIFMSGGDAEEGMRILQHKNMAEFLRTLAKEGKLFIGVSAGSIMMCKEWVRWKDPENYSTAELFPCLGLVPIICDTHAEKDDWVELKAALELAGNGTTGYGISSGSCIKVYPDGKLEPKGTVVRYVSNDGEVIKRSDL
jgi:peptidase E